jgi:hypothetical protein
VKNKKAPMTVAVIGAPTFTGWAVESPSCHLPKVMFFNLNGYLVITLPFTRMNVKKIKPRKSI